MLATLARVAGSGSGNAPGMQPRPTTKQCGNWIDVGHPCTGGGIGIEIPPGMQPGPSPGDRKNMPDQNPSKPHRLRRLATIWTLRGRPLFFVTLCTADRRRWLDSAEVHHAFRDFCMQSPRRADAWIGKYVLMPDHIHAFVSVAGSAGLSRWVGALKRHLAKVRRNADPSGLPPVGRAWQDGFFDHLLRSGESYIEKWNYVRLNPVRAGLAIRPEDWPYMGEIEILRW